MDEALTGRALDAEIARLVFGQTDIRMRSGKWVGGPQPWAAGPCQKRDGVPSHPGAGVLCHSCGSLVPRYSSEIAAAWQVVERCTAISSFGYRDVNGLPVATWFMAHFEKAGLWSCTASEAAEVICRIALKAIAGERVG